MEAMNGGIGRMIREKEIYKTHSLCPICMKKIDASLVVENNEAFIKKHCTDHGSFKTRMWKGSIDIEKWMQRKEKPSIENPSTAVELGCPFDCGLCEDHRQNTCTALIEVTENCNLNCRFCFADSKTSKTSEPSIEEIRFQIRSLMNISGKCNLQFSGGEPTVREDLDLIIKIAREEGFEFIQVNTNGIRIAGDEKYLKGLKDAGLSSIFLQFDGTEDNIYRELRGKDLFQTKIKAIENCKKHGVAVILVPTLVPGVNTHNIGGIIDFALQYLPEVKGVHFQPVSYFGRVPFIPRDEDRITLPELIQAIESQTHGKISKESLKPPSCEHPLCSFNGSYIYDDGKEEIKVKKSSKCCGKVQDSREGYLGAKNYVSRNWALKEVNNSKCKCDDSAEISSDWDRILDSINNKSFSISAMAFQDIWNLDLDRLRECCIHVVSPEGSLIPFCIYNISNRDGKYLYRR